MLVRRFSLPLAVCAIALLSSPVWAQNVFAPAEDTPPAGQGQTFNPYGNGGNSAPANPAPQQGGGLFAPAPDAPVNTPRAARPQDNLPQAARPSQRPVPAGERDEFAYRTLGLEVPSATAANSDPLAAFTPEQIETARKGFAAMEADNPQMISRNPFRQIDAMAATEKAQATILARAQSSCGSQNLNIMVSPQSFTRHPGSAEGLNSTGVAMVGTLLQQICSDSALRTKLTTNVPMVTIVNRANAPANVITTDGIITLSADFASSEPPQTGVIRAAFVKAIEDTDKFMTTQSVVPGQQ